jgi:hypothetical protein
MEKFFRLAAAAYPLRYTPTILPYFNSQKAVGGVPVLKVGYEVVKLVKYVIM